jgi:hypothetical protein
MSGLMPTFPIEKMENGMDICTEMAGKCQEDDKHLSSIHFVFPNHLHYLLEY